MPEQKPKLERTAYENINNMLLDINNLLLVAIIISGFLRDTNIFYKIFPEFMHK